MSLLSICPVFIWYDYLCTRVLGRGGFSFPWLLLYFSINAVLEIYLLDLYSYGKYLTCFCFFWKKENHQAASTVWSFCARFDLYSLYYLIQPEVSAWSLLHVSLFEAQPGRRNVFKTQFDALSSNAKVACLIRACGTEKTLVSYSACHDVLLTYK